MKDLRTHLVTVPITEIGHFFSSGWEHISLTQTDFHLFQLGRRKGGGKEKEKRRRCILASYQEVQVSA